MGGPTCARRRVHGAHKPAIAVLAFNNLSGDPSQDYFSDGISEEILNALARRRTSP